MTWAAAHGQIVFTHDLDFGAMLALAQATGASVLQLRGQRVLPEDMAALVAAALRRYEDELTAGALVVVEEARSRVRVLPL
jgi:predicted nuclease of predicted toxin-antitoxin system